MERLWSQLAPRKQVGELASVVVDAVRSRRELVLENAVLRHQVNVLRRSSKRRKLSFVDRLKLLLGARWLPSWRRVIVLVQPETLLRWHRAGFRRFWRRRSRPQKTSPLAPETIDLIRDMAARGRLWGAERIRGELLKLGVKVTKWTVQKYMRGVRGKNGGGQSWATFVKNHAERMWVCDFIQTHDLLFRQVYAFFIVHLASRRVVHVAATRHPTEAWTTQQLRNATMDGEAPAVLLRDRDAKFGPAFDRAAQGVGAKVIRTAVRAPNMNAVAERFVGSARREVLDHVLLVNDQHLASLLRQYQSYFNESRPHQGLGQRIPADPVTVIDPSKPIAVRSVLGGLHVDYRRAA
jgi:transposase InsO family protein